ncbi:uncharacterized protein LOC130894314 [Diorhabda carinulata]|uniref:uncharacterized protein LOC130894314 n=1 Tax=Diorhabda carinulata TaxID=1163345 RepID=UPI0025A231D4|nr:uncharacterized protein LOC130894314 [Diorhabda carinulata]
MENPIVKPDVPYKGKIPGGLVPGRMCRIQGVSHPDSDRFNINFQVGPKPSDDTALHISVRHKQGYIARNSYINEEWGEEQGEGELRIGEAESWEIIVLVDESDYKIAVNGQHFCEFPHRISYSKVTDLLIDGEVSITLISWEGIMGLGAGDNVKKVSQTDNQQWSPQGGNGAPQGAYYPPQGGYAPGPGYGPPPQGYGPTPPQGYGPPPPPGGEPQSSFDSFLDGAQTLLSGAIKSGAAGMLVGKLLGGGGNDPQRGYAHNNAKYGIYPDLPQDTNLNINQAPSKGPLEQLLSGLIAGGGAGQQPGTGNPTSTGAPGQQGQVDYAALLTNLLSGNQESKVSQAQGAPQGPGNQQSGPDIGSFLSGLLSSHNQPPAGPQQQPVGGINQQHGSQTQQQGAGDIGSLLSGLLSGHNQQTGSQSQPGSQTHGVDFGGLLTNLLSGNATRPIQETGTHHSTPPSNTRGTQSQGTDFGSLLSNLLSSGSQQPQPGYNQGTGGHQGPGPQQQSSGIDLNSLLSSLLSSTGGVHPPYGGMSPYGKGNPVYGGPASGQPYPNPPMGNQPYTGPPAGNQPHSGPAAGNHPQPYSSPTGSSQAYSDTPTSGSGTYQSSVGQTGGIGIQRHNSAPKPADTHFEDVSDQLEQEMARQGGHVQYSAQQSQKGQENDGQQYGYYPHPPEQQRGPVENLLSGLLSGGQQPHQQPHIPQFGGGESVGGLGSMGGLLQNFAGQLFNPRDGNHRQNY